SFALVTAPFLICLVPTLLAGNTIAAYELADSDMNSARNAVTLANVTLFRRIARFRMRLTPHPFPEARKEAHLDRRGRHVGAPLFDQRQPLRNAIAVTPTSAVAASVTAHITPVN